jgi:hypothetical protein
MWIADSDASNHVTFSDKGCRNKRIVTGLTHGIVGESVLPKCELDIHCIHHYEKDGMQMGEVIITDVPKVSTGEKATVMNGRWFHHNSTLKVHKGETGPNKIWDFTVNQLTGIPFTGIYSKK